MTSAFLESESAESAPVTQTAQVEAQTQAQVEQLTALNFQDFLNAVGLKDIKRGRRLAEAVFSRPADRFARQVAEYDQRVGRDGLALASSWLLQQMTGELRVFGAQHVPTHGPVMIASNHPGATDTLALFASIPRPDLATLAADRPFLRVLTHVQAHLINVSEAIEDRMLAVRVIAREFRRGRAILTFPAGKIEPDPNVLPGAPDSLQSWSASIGAFARLVPELQIVPTIVRGVLAPGALRNPLIYLRRTYKDRELMAAMLQIVLKRYHNVQVTVTFGQPVCAADLGDVNAITQTVIARANALIIQNS